MPVISLVANQARIVVGADSVPAAVIPVGSHSPGVPRSFEMNVAASVSYEAGFIPNYESVQTAMAGDSRILFRTSDADLRVSQQIGVNEFPLFTSEAPGAFVGAALAEGVDLSITYEQTAKCFQVWLSEDAVSYTRIVNLPRLDADPYYAAASATLAFYEMETMGTEFGPVYQAAQIVTGTQDCPNNRARIEVSVFVNMQCTSVATRSVSMAFTSLGADPPVSDSQFITFPPPLVDKFVVVTLFTDVVPAGEWEVDVTISSGAVITSKNIPYVHILEPVVMTLTPTPAIAGCGLDQISWCADDGEILTAVTGGTGGGTVYDISTLNLSDGSIITGPDPMSLGPTTYSVSARDCHDCEDVQLVTLSRMPDPEVVPTITCGADIALAVTACHGGAFTFAWDAPLTSTTNTVTDLDPGTYSVDITDMMQGCSRNYEFTIPDFSFVGPFAYRQAPCRDIAFEMDLEFFDIVTCNTANLDVTVDYGDGASEVLTPAQIDLAVDGTGFFRLSHSYALRQANYTVTVTVIANDYPMPNTYVATLMAEVRFLPGFVPAPRPLDKANPADAVYWYMYHAEETSWSIDPSIIARFTGVEVVIERRGNPAEAGLITDPITRTFRTDVNGTALWAPHHLFPGRYLHYTFLLPGRCVLNGPREIWLRVAEVDRG